MSCPWSKHLTETSGCLGEGHSNWEINKCKELVVLKLWNLSHEKINWPAVSFSKYIWPFQLDVNTLLIDYYTHTPLFLRYLTSLRSFTKSNWVNECWITSDISTNLNPTHLNPQIVKIILVVAILDEKESRDKAINSVLGIWLKIKPACKDSLRT